MNNLRNLFPLLYDFYIVAKEQSFSRASEKSGIAQSNLSRNIKNLEIELNVILINRNSKGITLTNDGIKLYNDIDKPFSNFETIKYNDELEGFTNGLITIGLTRNIADNFFCKYLNKFKQKYPNVKIKILTDSADNLNDYLINHKIDFLIDYLPHINYSQKLELTVEAIGYFQTCFACSKKTYQEIKVSNLKELTNYNLVIPGSSRRRQMLDEILQSNNVKLFPSVEMPDSKLMIDFVSNTDYIGYFIEEEINGTDLIPIKLNAEMPKNFIGLIYPTHVMNNLAKEFVNIILEEKDIL